MKRFFTIVPLLFLFLGMNSFCEFLQENPPGTPQEINYHVIIERPEHNRVYIVMTISGKKNQKLRFLHKSDPKEYIINGISGKSLRKIFTFFSSEEIYEITTGNDGTAIINYSIAPGQKGRHGHQGYIGKDFAILDGRIFLIPEKEDEFKSVSVKYSMPKNWNIVTPFKKEATSYNPFYEKKALLFTSLGKSFMAFGRFSKTERLEGGVKVQVFTYEKWNDTFKNLISNKAFILFAYFRNLFGNTMTSPYVICFVPRSDDGERILGGVWSNGQGFEMPEDYWRNWQLFSHRLAHVYNEYEPYGLDFKNKEDTWFIEGWAAFVELASNEETGLNDSSKTWKRLFDDYKKKLSVNRWKYDVPISKQFKVRDKNVIEFLHYTKAPLIALALDKEIRKATSNRKSLNGFMSYLYERFGCHREKIDLMNELNLYTNQNFSWFYDSFIKSRGNLSPPY